MGVNRQFWFILFLFRLILGTHKFSSGSGVANPPPKDICENVCDMHKVVKIKKVTDLNVIVTDKLQALSLEACSMGFPTLFWKF